MVLGPDAEKPATDYDTCRARGRANMPVHPCARNAPNPTLSTLNADPSPNPPPSLSRHNHNPYCITPNPPPSLPLPLSLIRQVPEPAMESLPGLRKRSLWGKVISATGGNPNPIHYLSANAYHILTLALTLTLTLTQTIALNLALSLTGYDRTLSPNPNGNLPNRCQHQVNPQLHPERRLQHHPTLDRAMPVPVCAAHRTMVTFSNPSPGS